MPTYEVATFVFQLLTPHYHFSSPNTGIGTISQESTGVQRFSGTSVNFDDG